MPDAELVAEQIFGGAVNTPYPSEPVNEYRRASRSLECADLVCRAVSANLIGNAHDPGYPAGNLGHHPDGFGSKRLRTPEKRHAPVAALRGKNSRGPLVAISGLGN